MAAVAHGAKVTVYREASSSPARSPPMCLETVSISAAESVHAAAFSVDGRLLATGGTLGIISLYHLAGGTEPLRVLRGHESYVHSIAFSPDGIHLVSASEDSTVRVWSIDEKQQSTVLHGHSSAVYCALFSPDGRLIVSGGEDASVRLWTLMAGRNESYTLCAHASPVLSVAFSRNGAMLASGGMDKSIVLWKVAGRTQQRSLCGHEDAVRCLCYSADGSLLYSGSDDATVKVWSVDSGVLVRTLVGHKSYVMSLCISANCFSSPLLVTASRDRRILLWNADTGDQLAALTAHTDTVRCVAFPAAGSILCSVGYDQTVRLWFLKQAQPCVTISCTSQVTAVAFAPVSGVIAVGTDRGELCMYSGETGAVFHRAATLHKAAVTCLSFSQPSVDGGEVMLASADASGVLRIWCNALTKCACCGELSASKEKGKCSQIFVLEWSTDAKIIASADYCSVSLWFASTRTLCCAAKITSVVSALKFVESNDVAVEVTFIDGVKQRVPHTEGGWFEASMRNIALRVRNAIKGYRESKSKQ